MMARTKQKGMEMRVSVWVAVVCPGTSRVLLAKRGPTTRNAGRWNFFGGGLDPGEHPEETAIRELAEEAGIDSHPDDLIYLGDSVSGSKRNLLFVVTTEAEFEPIINHESQAWAWVSIDDLLALHPLHGPTQKLSPLVRSWSRKIPRPPAKTTNLPQESRWDWLVRQVARHW